MESFKTGYVPLAIIQRAKQHKDVEPASIAIAQAIIESSNGDPSDGMWFDSSLVTDHNNVFGHKWTESSIANGYVEKTTNEWVGGVKTRKVQRFASYADLDQCFKDHRRIMKLKYYDAARLYVRTPAEYAKRLSGIYSTDPAYGKNLIDLCDRYNLWQYDTEPLSPAPALGDKIMSPINAILSIVSLSGKKKWLSYVGSMAVVLFNHFVAGHPDPLIDKVVLGLTAVYQGVEGALDAIRTYVNKIDSTAGSAGPKLFANDGSQVAGRDIQ